MCAAQLCGRARARAGAALPTSFMTLRSGSAAAPMAADGPSSARPLLAPSSDSDGTSYDETTPCSLVPETPILFFDGHCNLCNFFVSFFLKLDAGNDPVRIKVASLQSPQVAPASPACARCTVLTPPPPRAGQRCAA